MRMRSLLTILVLGALPLMGACGGGGNAPSASAGSPVDPLTLLTGTYYSTSFGGNQLLGTARWGTWIGDGAGAFLAPGSVTSNSNGAINGPFPTTLFDYHIDADRVLKFLPTSGGVVTMLGAISADGSLAFGCSVLGPTDLMIMGRQQGTHSNASLQGQYHLCAFFYYEVTDAGATFFGSASFDGIGGGTATTESNIGGVIGGIDTGPITYNVAADGTVTGSFSLDVPFTLEGSIVANGDLVVLGGGAAGQAPILVVLVKAAVGASNATLSGTYASALIAAFGTAPPTWFSMITNAKTTSPGILELSPVLQNIDGMLTVPGFTSVGLDYAVLPDGRLLVEGGGPQNYRGGVSQSGDVAVFCGPANTGVGPQLWFLIR